MTESLPGRLRFLYGFQENPARQRRIGKTGFLELFRNGRDKRVPANALPWESVESLTCNQTFLVEPWESFCRVDFVTVCMRSLPNGNAPPPLFTQLSRSPPCEVTGHNR